MYKISKFFKYIYWLGAKVQYKYFGESGENGIFLLTNIFIFSLATFFFLLYDGTYEVTTSLKFIIVFVTLIIYYIIGKLFKGVPIKDNEDFKNISESKRIFHTILLYLAWGILFFSLLYAINI